MKKLYPLRNFDFFSTFYYKKEFILNYDVDFISEFKNAFNLFEKKSLKFPKGPIFFVLEVISSQYFFLLKINFLIFSLNRQVIVENFTNQNLQSLKITMIT